MSEINQEMELKKFPGLQTERLKLVEITYCHLKNILELFGNENVTKFYNILPFTTEQDSKKFIDWYKNRFQDNLAIRWGLSLKDENKLIGTIGFNNFTKSHRASIGYDLMPEYWHQGYITEALKEILKFGFNQLSLNRVEAEIMQGNDNSEKLLYKLNFKKEGILRQWMFWNGHYYDMSMFSLLRVEYEKNQTANH